MRETPDIETVSEAYASRFAGPVGKYLLAAQERLTLELVGGLNSGCSVLDVGGGHGQLAVPLVRKGFRVTVVGSTTACRRILDRKLSLDRFVFLACDLTELPFLAGSFDAVLGFRLLAHLDNWRKLIAEMCRVSKSTVIVDYPDVRSFNFLYRLFFSLKKRIEGNTRPFRVFSRKDLIGEFQRNGFGNPVSRPQFLFPMVVHRAMGSIHMSRVLEEMAARTGCTQLYGSPVILRVSKD